MRSTSPDSVIPETCVSAAVAAPSIHNTQPWGFRLDPESAFCPTARLGRIRTACPSGVKPPIGPRITGTSRTGGPRGPPIRGATRVVLRLGRDPWALILGASSGPE